MKIVFFGTPKISVPALEALIKDPQFDVVGVVTEPEKKKGRGQKEAVHSPVFEVAKKYAIPILTPLSVKKDEEVQQKINSWGADIYVVIAYGKIIPAAIFDAPPHGTVNIHYSLLPELRGPSPVQWALLEGKEKTGVTLMEIDEEMDHGRIISQKEVGVAPDDTFFTLAPKLNEVGVAMLINDLPPYVAGTLMPKEQVHENATYSKMISKEDGKVVWSRSAQDIYNQWRAFIQWPGIYTFLPTGQAGAGEKRLNLKEVKRTDSEVKREPGILQEEGGRLYITCGEGVLEILTIQPEGKQAMSAGAFINGYRHLLGSQVT